MNIICSYKWLTAILSEIECNSNPNISHLIYYINNLFQASYQANPAISLIPITYHQLSHYFTNSYPAIRLSPLSAISYQAITAISYQLSSYHSYQLSAIKLSQLFMLSAICYFHYHTIRVSDFPDGVMNWPGQGQQKFKKISMAGSQVGQIYYCSLT